jgi:hypothetical protein
MKTTTFRIPEEIWEALVEEAQAQHRSANGQLVHLLSGWYDVRRVGLRHRVAGSDPASEKSWVDEAALPSPVMVTPGMVKRARAEFPGLFLANEEHPDG